MRSLHCENKWRIMVRYPSVLSYTMMLDVERWKHGHNTSVAALSAVVHYNRSCRRLADCSSTIPLMTASHPCTIYLSCKCNMTDSQLLLYHLSSSTTIIQGSRSIRKAVLPDSWRCVIFMTWFWWLQWKDSKNNELLSIPLRKGSPWICIALCIKFGHHGLSVSTRR